MFKLNNCSAARWLLSVPATCYCISETDLLHFMCCHTEIEVADQTFYLTQSQYTNTGPTIPSADSRPPGARQGSHWSASFEVTGMARPGKSPLRKRELNRGSAALESDTLATWSKRWFKLTREVYIPVDGYQQKAHYLCY